MVILACQQHLRLNLSWRRPLSYRNQSIDLLRKSLDWFLCDHGLRHERVKKKIFINCNMYDIFYLRYTALDAMSLREPIKTSSRLKWQNYFSLQKANKQKAKTDILCYEENTTIQQSDVWQEHLYIISFFVCSPSYCYCRKWISEDQSQFRLTSIVQNKVH